MCIRDSGCPKENTEEDYWWWRFYIGEDGRAYHDDTEKLRPIYPEKYYFFVSPDKYEDVPNVIKKEYCSEQMTITSDAEQQIKIDNQFFNVFVYPRSSDNLLEDLEEEEEKKVIRDVLPEFKVIDDVKEYEKNVKAVSYTHLRAHET